VGGTHRIAEWMDRSPQGQSFKWHAVYPEPFCGADGVSGFGLDVDNPLAPEARDDRITGEAYY
jgi:hypothetical protein